MSAQVPASLVDHLTESIHSGRRRYRKRLERCRKKFSPGAVHALRIESRRILALLDLLDAMRYRGSRSKLRKVIKKRLDSFDELRDTQVQLRLLRAIEPDFPQARAWAACLRRREQKLVRRLNRRVKSMKYARLNRRLKDLERPFRKCAGVGSGGRSGALASAALRRIFAGVAARRRKVHRDSPATIHRLRVAFKRFRYVSELLHPLVPDLTPRKLARMKTYQAAAGDIQDLEVLLARLAEAIDDGEVDSRASEPMRNELLRRRRRAIDSFTTRIDELDEFRPDGPRGRTAG